MKDGDFSDGIYWILDAVNYQLGGGYDVSSGINYKNDVFETRNFWSDADEDCDCGYDDWESKIDEEVMKRIGDLPFPSDQTKSFEWWRNYRREFVNVSQGEERSHETECIVLRPQFQHFASGLKVTWYKRVGRSTKSNQGMKTLDWFKVVVECLESVRNDAP